MSSEQTHLRWKIFLVYCSHFRTRKHNNCRVQICHVFQFSFQRCFFSNAFFFFPFRVLFIDYNGLHSYPMLFWVAVLTGAFDFGIRTSHNLSWPLSLRQWVWNWKRFKVDGRRELLCILVFRQAVCDLLWFIFCCFLSEICKWCLLVSFICYTLCLCQRQSCGDLGFKRQHVRVFFFWR